MEDYSHLLIAEHHFWQVYLHGNQCYLGRSYIWAKRENLVDLLDATKAEREELFEIGRVMKLALINLFQPNHFNYASLGNISPRCHWHIIPRYKSPRRYAGKQFVDRRWGQNYAPYDEFRVSADMLQTIKNSIISKMNPR